MDGNSLERKKYAAYLEYKDSNVIWIGSYPESWSLTRVKFEAYVKARVGWHGLKSDDFTDEGPYLVTGSDFRGPRIEWENCYHCDEARYEQDPYIQLKEGDLLLTKDGTIGKVALVEGLNNEKATLNSGVFVVRPTHDNFSTRFYYWLLLSKVFTDFVDYNKTGSTIVHLYQDTFVNFSYAAPTSDEEIQIACFLDHETAKIDTLIEEQQSLIRLLKEKRQAVISYAITKGLNPDAPMKNSGVEWLGEVPEHWTVLRLFHVGKVGQGCSFPHAIQGQEEGDLPWFKVADMNLPGNDEIMKKSDNSVSHALAENISAPIFPADTIIFPRVGAALLTNKRRILSRPSIVDDNIYTYTPTGIRSRFAFFVLQLLDMATLCSPGLVPTITFSAINNIRISLPPLSEQDEIIGFVDKQINRVNELVKEAEFAITLMQERRTALISAAVTGKIDVRDWVAPP
ncbi:restriction endonuclease subunit S [Endozoicomonas sp. SESOKO4]|uniref:restriction endonuclease subunit S n=1 Tax=Endozoicomonas sp. SESOKO4 TaxID=2828745 RepID=UPI0021483A49|nr:restriction endonuclease subunit S [Endozoicomonas sp. SESOKO4]